MRAPDYGYDVRYQKQRSYIGDSHAKGADNDTMRGTTTYSYDPNGHLAFLDRGVSTRPDAGGERSVARFTYDANGRIQSRTDRASPQATPSLIERSHDDPATDVTTDIDDYGNIEIHSRLDTLYQTAFNGQTSTTAHLQNFLYANGEPVAEGATNQQLLLKTLVVQGAKVETQPADHLLTLQASDIVTDPITNIK